MKRDPKTLTNKEKREIFERALTLAREEEKEFIYALQDVLMEMHIQATAELIDEINDYE